MKTCVHCGASRQAFLGSRYCDSCDALFLSLDISHLDLRPAPWGAEFARKILEGADFEGACRHIGITKEVGRRRQAALPWFSDLVEGAIVARDGEKAAALLAKRHRDAERQRRARRRQAFSKGAVYDRFYRPIAN